MPYKCRKMRLVIGMTLASCLFGQSAALALESSTTLTPVFDIPKIDIVQPISPTTNVGNASGIFGRSRLDQFIVFTSYRINVTLFSYSQNSNVVLFRLSI